MNIGMDWKRIRKKGERRSEEERRRKNRKNIVYNSIVYV
jgi:hypothetical protein